MKRKAPKAPKAPRTDVPVVYDHPDEPDLKDPAYRRYRNAGHTVTDGVYVPIATWEAMYAQASATFEFKMMPSEIEAKVLEGCGTYKRWVRSSDTSELNPMLGAYITRSETLGYTFVFDTEASKQTFDVRVTIAGWSQEKLAEKSATRAEKAAAKARVKAHLTDVLARLTSEAKAKAGQPVAKPAAKLLALPAPVPAASPKPVAKPVAKPISKPVADPDADLLAAADETMAATVRNRAGRKADPKLHAMIRTLREKRPTITLHEIAAALAKLGRTTKSGKPLSVSHIRYVLISVAS